MRIALFPLHTVLFPGMALPLHIFEPRYLKMISACLAGQAPFGVALIRAGAEVGAPAVPHQVGTLARIRTVETLPDGRMNIEAVGHDRFRLRSRQVEPAGFLTGEVELFPLQDDDAPAARQAARSLAPWYGRYLQLLGQAASTRLDTRPLPEDPQTLAYLAAIVAQLPMPEKQALLAIPSLVGLLEAERALYRREISLLRAMLATARPTGQPSCSPN